MERLGRIKQGLWEVTAEAEERRLMAEGELWELRRLCWEVSATTIGGAATTTAAGQPRVSGGDRELHTLRAAITNLRRLLRATTRRREEADSVLRDCERQFDQLQEQGQSRGLEERRAFRPMRAAPGHCYP